MRAARKRVSSSCLLSLLCAFLQTWQTQGSSAQTNPRCTSSNGSVLSCSWSRDDLKDPDAEVLISDVSYLRFGINKPMTYDGSCSINVTSHAASCDVTVTYDDNNCRSNLNISFSAVTRNRNITESMVFKHTQVLMEPPSKINATALSTDEIEIRWGSPLDPVCPMVYYCIQLQYSSTHNTTWLTAFDQWRDLGGCNGVKRRILKRLLPGTLHYLRIRAKVSSDAEFGTWSKNVTAQTFEKAPTGFVKILAQTDQRMTGHPFDRAVHLSWKGLGGTSRVSYLIQIPSLGRNWTTNETAFTIRGLDSFSDYQGYISGFNSAGHGEQTTFTILDMTSPPQTPTLNYTKSPTSIALSIIAPVEPNGVIIKYKIRWRDYLTDIWLNTTIQWSDSSPVIRKVTIPHLKPNTPYIVEVQAFNKLGGSAKHSVKITTPQKVPSFVPRNFTIDTVQGMPDVVEIEWTHLQQFGDMVSGYNVLYCALNGTLLSKNNTLCEDRENVISINKADGNVPDSSPYRVGGLTPFTCYSFRLQPFNDAGDGPISEPVLVQTPQGAPSSPIDMKVSRVASSFSIDVTWSPPLTPNGVIIHYAITYNANTTRTNATFVRLNVFGDTEYVIGVSACTQPGTWFACGNVTTLKFTTPIMAPSAPILRGVLPSAPTKVKVRWDAPEHPNGPLEDYIIKVWPITSSFPFFENATVGVANADMREGEVQVNCGEDSREEREFQIEISARTINDEGYQLEGNSDTKAITMCGSPKRISAVWLILVIGFAILVPSLILAVLVYRRWFRTSRKLDIYFQNIINVRKRNKRLQQLRIPKPIQQESEVFDVLRAQPLGLCDIKPSESVYETGADPLTVYCDQAMDRDRPRSVGYLSKETTFYSIMPKQLKSR